MNKEKDKTTEKKKTNTKNKATEEKKTNTRKTTKKSSSTKTEKVTKKSNDTKLEDTTRIRVDDVRINDADSLDVSFIDGRKSKKVDKDKKAKENILKEKKDYSSIFDFLKLIIVISVIGVVLFLGSLAIKNTNFFSNNNDNKESKEKKEPEKIKISYNYLFVGDSYTDNMNFDGFLYSYVKVSNKEYTTSDLLDNLNDDVYVYNPSSVFIELGYNDLVNGVEENTILNNIEDIIKGIKSNREYAKIYVESLYPINSDVEGYKDNNIDNDTIKKFNTKLEKLVKSLDVNYIDMYSELLEDNALKESYTDDGVLLNDDGYRRVFKVINKIVDEEHER